MAKTLKKPKSLEYIYETNFGTVVGSTSSGWQDAVTTSEKLGRNREYLVIVKASIGFNLSGGSDYLVGGRLIEVYNGSVFNNSVMTREPMDHHIPHTYSYATIFKASRDTYLTFQHYTSWLSMPPNTHLCSIVAIDITDLKEGDDYFFSEESGQSDANTTSYRDRIQKIIEPSSSNEGEWLVIGGYNVDINSVTRPNCVELYQNVGSERGSGTTLNTPSIREEGEDLLDVVSGFLSRHYSVSSTDSTTTWKIRTKDIGAGDDNVYMGSYLIGLNLSRFEDIFTFWDNSSTETAVTSFYDNMPPASKTFSNSGKALILSCGVFDGQAAARNYKSKVLFDSTDIFSKDALTSPFGMSGRTYDSGDELQFIDVGLVDVIKDASHSLEWKFRKWGDEVEEFGSEDNSFIMFSLKLKEVYHDSISSPFLKSKVRKSNTPRIPTIGRR